MGDVLHFVSVMREIDFVLKLQGYTPEVLCSIFKNTVTFQEDNQRAIEFMVVPQIRLLKKHTAINYDHFQSFLANGDVEIQNIDTKE